MADPRWAPPCSYVKGEPVPEHAPVPAGWRISPAPTEGTGSTTVPKPEPELRTVVIHTELLPEMIIRPGKDSKTAGWASV